MRFLIFIYGKSRMKRTQLVSDKRAECHILLPKDDFSLERTVFLQFKNISGEWFIKETDCCHLKTEEFFQMGKRKSDEGIFYKLSIGRKNELSVGGKDLYIQLIRYRNDWSIYKKYKLRDCRIIKEKNIFIMMEKAINRKNSMGISYEYGKWFIEKCGNIEIYINEILLEKKQQLEFGDVICIGTIYLLFFENYIAVEAGERNTVSDYGKYRILSVIGQGGMSTVYLAVHERLKQKWAVKEISMEYCENYEMISRKLIVEADILKRLDHPGLPKIVDIIEKKDAIWMVMEFIEGKTLKEILNERGRIEEKEILIWGKQLCEVLSYLHSKKPSIIYRDLKPENIILKKTGRLVLIDFGTAREYCYKNTACDAMYLGTKGYAAPEQYGGMGQTDARTDIYCLGVTLYSLLTGYNPEKPPYKIYPEKYWGEHISLEMKSLLLKCIQSEPEKRYQNCRELAYALSQIDYKKQKEKENERRKIIKFLIFMMVGQLSLMFCIGCKKVSFCYKEEAVVRYINAAEKSEDKKEASQYYKLALELIPEEKLIYQSMVKYFIRLNHFQIEDAVILLDLINSVCEEGAVIEVFQKHNALGYAEFSYALGLGYFYDMGNITGKGASEKWFCEAIDTMTSQDENEAFGKQKRKRAGLYAKIANYYNTFLLNGTDQSGERGTGDFMDFYKTLHSLNQFEVTQKSTKSDLAAAYLISREITIEIMNYAEQFLKDSSINKKMLNKELEKIEERTKYFIKEKKQMEELYQFMNEAKQKIEIADSFKDKEDVRDAGGT